MLCKTNGYVNERDSLWRKILHGKFGVWVYEKTLEEGQKNSSLDLLFW